MEAGRAVASWGLLFRKQESILLDRVDSRQQRRGILNKLFKNGSVSIMTAGSSRPDLVMQAAEGYETIYKELKERSKKD